MGDSGRMCRLMSVGTGYKSRDKISCETKSDYLRGEARRSYEEFRIMRKKNTL